MYDIETTEEFDTWLMNIRDGKTQKVIVKRIRTMSTGSLGRIRALTGGLFEVKIRYGPGFRSRYEQAAGGGVVQPLP
jgi:putative addiction module killer protein